MRGQPLRHAAGVGALPLHAQREGLDAAHGQVAFERPQHRPDGARQARAGRRSARRRSPPTPPSTSPWPARYLVTLCTLKCAPNSSGRAISGVAKVLSTTSAAPASRAISAMRSICAHAQQRIGDGLHQDAARPGLPPPPRAARPGRRHRRSAPPRRCGSSTFISRLTVAPYSALAATTDFRRSASAVIRAMWSAAMPEAQASAPWPPSSDVTSSSSAAVVGLS